MISLVHIARISSFTIFQAVCSTAIALVIGLTAGFWTARRQFIGRRFLLSLSSVPMCIPPLLIALGFISVWGRAGVLNKFFQYCFGLQEASSVFLYSIGGIVIAQGFYNFPIVMATVCDTWAKLPDDEANAARLLGASEKRIFHTITLYQLLPAIVSSAMLVFLYCFFSFMIILLFGTIGTTTLETEIYQSARSLIDFKRAGLLAITETTLAALFVTLYSSLEQKSSRTRGVSFSAEHKRKHIRSMKERFSFAVTLILIALFFLAPLAGIVGNAFSSARESLTFATFLRMLHLPGFFNALGTTLWTASVTGLLCMTIGFFYAVLLRTIDPLGQNIFLRVIPMLPMAISSVVMGFVLTLLVKRGNALLLIIAQTALAWPLAFRQIYASLSKLPQETEDAARMLSTKKRHLLFRIYLPYSLRGMLSAAGFCFAVSAGDTTLPLVLALPRFNTLALLTYRLASSYRFNEACATGLILGALCAGVFGIANALKNGRNRQR